MRAGRLLKVAGRSLARNKMRSLLTMLGVIIGVGSVVAMVSLGGGAQTDVRKQISSMGTNLLMVRPGSSQTRGVFGGTGSLSTLTMDDVARLRKEATQLAAVSPVVTVREQAIAGGKNWNTSVQGVSPEYLTIRNWAVAEGVFFGEQDERVRSKVAVLGASIATQLFGKVSPIGSLVRVRNVPLRVIGVLAAKGTSVMGSDQDDVIVVPSSTALYRLGDGKTVGMIQAAAKSEGVMNEAEVEITRLLRAEHRLNVGKEDDFHVDNQTDMIEMISSVTSTLTSLLGAVAGISLLVGGIGIMNIMLVSVTERTREIGIRMAVGARGRDVLWQFLVEAVVLSTAGGMIGLAVGVAAAKILGAATGSTAVLSPQVMVVAVLFTGAVGVFFGFYPARKAARLNPIQALRYE
jgi:putative ABC transport system permease protein